MSQTPSAITGHELPRLLHGRYRMRGQQPPMQRLGASRRIENLGEAWAPSAPGGALPRSAVAAAAAPVAVPPA
jgi:hypothetical protein